jgi:hypothetical protein
MSAEDYLWMAIGAYFVLIGCGRLPVPKGGIGDWFDEASRERFRLSLRPLGVGLIVFGVAICLRLL